MIKLFVILLLLVLALLLPAESIAEQVGYALRTMEKAWSDASKKSGVQLDHTAKAQVLEQYKDLSAGAQKAIESQPPEFVENQIALYLWAKKQTGAPNVLSKKEVRDFSWYYIYYKTGLISVRLKPRTSATISTIITKDLSFPYQVYLESNRDTSLIIPAKGDSFSIRATTAEGNLIWTVTGLPSSGDVILHQSASKGCEVYVNSDPDKAGVYFNDVKYHRLTNTSSVREPGKWKVMIKKDDYEDWREERNLESGEAWTINAKLKPIKK